jgi:hypothetical protein
MPPYLNPGNPVSNANSLSNKRAGVIFLGTALAAPLGFLIKLRLLSDVGGDADDPDQAAVQIEGGAPLTRARKVEPSRRYLSRSPVQGPPSWSAANTTTMAYNETAAPESSYRLNAMTRARS